MPSYTVVLPAVLAFLIVLAYFPLPTCGCAALLLTLAGFHVSSSDVSRLRSLPNIGWVYSNVLIGAITKRRWLGEGVNRIDSQKICLAAPIAVNPETLEAYKKLVQMNRGYNHIPLMYFIVEPFSLSMLCMARSVPISLLGLVLARNESECFRAVNPDEPLTLSVHMGEKIERTEKGDAELEFIMDATDANDFVVWKSSTVVFVRNPQRPRRKKSSAEDQKPIEGEVLDTWSLAEDTGRRYGALNGDVNPIHLYPWSSKLFGFKRPIAHALYLVGRSIATVENKKGLDVTGCWNLRTEFKRPTMLPTSLKFLDQSLGCPDGTTKFCVTTEDGLKEVITGTLMKK